jgi:hypothetical protein
MKPRIRIYFSRSGSYMYGYVVDDMFNKALASRGSWGRIPCDCWSDETGRCGRTNHSKLDRL